MQEPADAARVRQVAEMAQSLGMRVSALIVGDVKLVFSEPWPKSEPPQVREQQEDKQSGDPKLQALREKALKTLGHVPADNILLQLDGVM